MNALLRNVLALLAVLVSSSALAAETWAAGRKVLYSCDYGSSYAVEVTLSYRNDTLPTGTTVELVYGWDGGYLNTDGLNRPPFDWAGRQTVTASQSAPFTWSGTVSATTSTRTGTLYYSNLDFVWRVTLPGGSVFYDKGNPSTFGYYAAVLDNMPAPCTSSGFTGTPTALAVMSVVKW